MNHLRFELLAGIVNSWSAVSFSMSQNGPRKHYVPIKRAELKGGNMLFRGIFPKLYRTVAKVEWPEESQWPLPWEIYQNIAAECLGIE